MKLIKRITYRCAAVVQPGEYVIDRWDNLPCEETNPYALIKCEECEQYFCSMHWRGHGHFQVNSTEVEQ